MNRLTRHIIHLVIALFLVSCVPGGGSGSGSGRSGSLSFSEAVDQSNSGSTTGDVVTEEPEEEILTRPDDSLVIENACICQSGEALNLDSEDSETIGYCGSVCQGYSSSNTTLVGEVRDTGGLELSGIPGMEDLSSWCGLPIYDTDPLPSCDLSISTYVTTYDSNGELTSHRKQTGTYKINVLSTTDSDGKKMMFDVDIQGFVTSYNYGQNAPSYTISLMETTSEATTKDPGYSIQMPYAEDTTKKYGGLDTTNVHRYQCIYRNSEQDEIGKWHYYFSDYVHWNALNIDYKDGNGDPTEKYFFCYPADEAIYANATKDHDSFPRLNQVNNVLKLWSPLEKELTDTDQSYYIGQTINEKMKLKGVSTGWTDQLFYELKAYHTPPASQASVASGSEPTVHSVATIGYYLVPFQDKDTLEEYCPTSEHFNNNGTSPTDKLFKVLGEIFSINQSSDFSTEGLFMAIPTENNISVLGADVLFIRESTLENIWLEKQTNGTYIHTQEAPRVPYFYWDAQNNSNAEVDTGGVLYKVVNPNDVPDLSNTNTVVGSYKRIGCIPK